MSSVSSFHGQLVYFTLYIEICEPSMRLPIPKRGYSILIQLQSFYHCTPHNGFVHKTGSFKTTLLFTLPCRREIAILPLLSHPLHSLTSPSLYRHYKTEKMLRYTKLYLIHQLQFLKRILFFSFILENLLKRLSMHTKYNRISHFVKNRP